MKTPLFVVVEGMPDEAAVRAIASALGIDIHPPIIKRGKGNLDRSIAGYNRSAMKLPWLVLRDLDHDAPSACALLRQLLPQPAVHMRLRIAIREVESWLVADRERFAAFVGVRQSEVPRSPEDLDNPKQTVIALARRSRKREIREDMVPRPRSGANEGSAYASRLAEFARLHWRPAVAAGCSPSLRRCLTRLRELKAAWI